MLLWYVQCTPISFRGPTDTALVPRLLCMYPGNIITPSSVNEWSLQL
jgi:hypothetical protein